MKIICQNRLINEYVNKVDLYKMSQQDLKKNPNVLIGMAKLILMDFVKKWYDPETNYIVCEERDDILGGLISMLHCMGGIPSLHWQILYSILREKINSLQILFAEKKNEGIVPVKYNINHKVKGRLYANCEFEIEDEKFDLDLLQAYAFVLADVDQHYSHITVFFNFFGCSEVVFWDLVFNEKQNTNSNLQLLTEKYYYTEEEFIKYVRDKGIPVSAKTLRNYRHIKYQCIFPEPEKIIGKDGLERNYYDPDWIEYLKRIEELKKLASQYKTNVTGLRTLDKQLGSNTFDDIPIKKEKKQSKGHKIELRLETEKIYRDPR